MNSPINCGACKWWTPESEDATEGECHRFPPQEMLGDDDWLRGSFWPTTDFDDFCGEAEAGQPDEEN